MYRITYPALLALLLLSAGATANLQSQLEACMALPDKADQLACFDRLGAAGSAGPVAGRADLQDRLESCLTLTDKSEQLACFDRIGSEPQAAEAVSQTGSLQDRLGACVALSSKADQLACFDALEAGAPAPAAASAPTADGPGLQARLGDCIGMTDRSEQLACFDSIRGAGPGATAARMSESTGEYEYRARLSRVSDGRSFFMEDGQVWRALNPGPVPFRQGEVVIIRPEGGAFVMSQAGTDVTTGVTRVR